MTEPPYRGAEANTPPYGQFPPPVAYPQGYYPPGYYPQGYHPDPAALGRHPVTGEPLSDKTKTAAGLLQLLGLVGILGVGRIYLGYTGLGITQLLSGLLITFVTCGFGIVVPVIWGIVDAVLIFNGSVRDSQGRPLRDG